MTADLSSVSRSQERPGGVRGMLDEATVLQKLTIGAGSHPSWETSMNEAFFPLLFYGKATKLLSGLS